MALVGCDDFLSACYSCLEGDPSKQVAPEEISKIGIIATGANVPDGAKNVYYFEQCGIDCTQYIRFDLPKEQAFAYAKSIRKPSDKPFEMDMFPIINGVNLEWWIENDEGVSDVIYSLGDTNIPNDPYLDIAVLPHGKSARVYIHSWNM